MKYVARRVDKLIMLPTDLEVVRGARCLRSTRNRGILLRGHPSVLGELNTVSNDHWPTPWLTGTNGERPLQRSPDGVGTVP